MLCLLTNFICIKYHFQTEQVKGVSLLRSTIMLFDNATHIRNVLKISQILWWYVMAYFWTL
jgi:hypothetical protein